MPARPITHQLQLSQDRLIDLFLIQWNTPWLIRDNQWTKIDERLATEKLALIERFRDWLIRYYVPNTSSQATFIVFPELSVPLRCEAVLNNIADSLRRPTVIVAGLEYLRWAEYEQLLQGLPEMKDHCPEADAHFVVNSAGIWLRDSEHANTRRYIQSKIHPQDNEQAIPVYSGREVLIFGSEDQTPGRRLNFCVQICSDLTSQAFVTELRRQIVEVCPNVSLDFTFLIQSNPDQTAIQFNEAVQTYFDPPVDMSETERGSLVFINNANPNTGKSLEWGRSKLNFPRGRWRRAAFPAPTYWIKDYNAFNHQAVWLRESGPGIYWLTYKPQYLVPMIPGSGQLPPFPEASARFAYQHERSFEGGDDATYFKPIPANCHWLKGEIVEGGPEWADELQGLKDGIDDHARRDRINEVIDACTASYRTASEELIEHLSYRDDVARDAVSTYFGAWETHDQYPGKEPEPCEWSEDCSRGIKRMMRVLSLLVFAQQALPGGSLAVEVSGVHQASADRMRFTFMWGSSVKYPPNMVSYYQKNRQAYGRLDLLSAVSVLVLVDAVGAPPKEELLAGREDITKPSNYAPLKSTGEVVKITEPRLILLYNSELESQISVADGRADLEQRLVNVLERELA